MEKATVVPTEARMKAETVYVSAGRLEVVLTMMPWRRLVLFVVVVIAFGVPVSMLSGEE